MELIKPVSQLNNRPSALEVAPTIAKRLEENKAQYEAAKRKKRGDRLYSLDFLRGLDIFLLTVVCVVLAKINEFNPLPKPLMDQLTHPDWVGFTVYDMIMPLFIFMCGAALPLALAKRTDENGHAGIGFWKYVFQRVVMLWILGMVAQGRLFALDIQELSFFNNTLQAIAVGYLITAIVTRFPSKVFQIGVTIGLAAVYTAFLHLFGDMTPDENAAVVYELKLLKLFYPDSSCWAVRQIGELHYTWWTTVPMFGVMGLCGYQATSVLINEGLEKKSRASIVFIVGVILVLAGLGLALSFDPCVKHIYTASFTAIAMGVSFLLYAVCYFVCDIVKFRLGFDWITKFFGCHSLLAYMLAETGFNKSVTAVPDVMLEGLMKFLPPAQTVYVYIFVYVVTFMAIMVVWHGFKTAKESVNKAMAELKEHAAKVMV